MSSSSRISSRFYNISLKRCVALSDSIAFNSRYLEYHDEALIQNLVDPREYIACHAHV